MTCYLVWQRCWLTNKWISLPKWLSFLLFRLPKINFAAWTCSFSFSLLFSFLVRRNYRNRKLLEWPEGVTGFVNTNDNTRIWPEIVMIAHVTLYDDNKKIRPEGLSVTAADSVLTINSHDYSCYVVWQLHKNLFRRSYRFCR